MADDEKAPPKFAVGEKVIDFRGVNATVLRVIATPGAHRSHRVGVEWEPSDDPHYQNPDKRDYYEGVFDHA